MYDDLIQKLRNAGKESFLFGDLMQEAADIIRRARDERKLRKLPKPLQAVEV